MSDTEHSTYKSKTRSRKDSTSSVESIIVPKRPRKIIASVHPPFSSTSIATPNPRTTTGQKSTTSNKRTAPTTTTMINAAAGPAREPAIDQNMTHLTGFGPALQIPFFSINFKPTSLTSGMFVRQLHVSPFNGNWGFKTTTTMAFFATLGRSLMMRQDLVDTDSIFTVTIAELLGSYLDASCFVPSREIARTVLISSVRTLIAYGRLSSYTTGHDRVAFIADITNANADESVMRHPTTTSTIGQSTAEDWPEDSSTITYQNSIKILYWISRHAFANYTYSGTSAIVHACVSLAKRGIVSAGSVRKIQDGVMNDSNVMINLSINVIGNFYKWYCTKVNSENASTLLNKWTEVMPPECIRLVTIIQQASGGGLTSINSIIAAYKMFPTFPWGWMAALDAVDFSNATIAAGIVKNNPYVGYNRDLGFVKATLYPNTALLARELLVQGGGQSALASYAGWSRTASHSLEITRKVVEWMTTRHTTITEELIIACQPSVDRFATAIMD